MYLSPPPPLLGVKIIRVSLLPSLHVHFIGCGPRLSVVWLGYGRSNGLLVMVDKATGARLGYIAFNKAATKSTKDVCEVEASLDWQEKRSDVNSRKVN